MDEHEHRGASASGPILARRGFIALAGRTIGATVATTLLAACGGATAASTPATATSGTTPPAPAATPPAPPLAAPHGTSTPQATATSPATTATLPMPPTQNVTAPTAAASATPGLVAVRIVDFAFDPATVTIPVGTTVLWTNTGVQHTTTSSDNVWASAVLERGDTFRYQFTRPGTYPYLCGLHPDMQATIIVR